MLYLAASPFPGAPRTSYKRTGALAPGTVPRLHAEHLVSAIRMLPAAEIILESCCCSCRGFQGPSTPQHMRLARSRFAGWALQFLSCRRLLQYNTIRRSITGGEWNSYRYGVSVQTPTCSSKKPTRVVAANRTGMAGADPLLIAPGLKRKLGLWSKRRLVICLSSK